MVFIWVIFYGLTYTASQHIAGWLQAGQGIPSLSMSLYILVLILWLIKTRRGRRIGLCPPLRPLKVSIVTILPFAFLPLCNLLYTEQFTASWAALVILLCAAIAEELLLRGWLLFSLSANPLCAVGVSSLVFALLHAANLVNAADPQVVLLQMLCALFFGLFCGAVTLRSGSLLPAIGAHALVNLTGASAVLPPHAAAVCIVLYACCGILLCHPFCMSHKEKIR